MRALVVVLLLLCSSARAADYGEPCESDADCSSVYCGHPDLRPQCGGPGTPKRCRCNVSGCSAAPGRGSWGGVLLVCGALFALRRRRAEVTP